MTDDDFDYNAPQNYYNFNSGQDDLHEESYFDTDEDRIPSKSIEDPPKFYESISDDEEQYFSPLLTKTNNTPGLKVPYPLPGQLRKSLSMTNIRMDKKLQKDDLSLQVSDNHYPRPSSACSSNSAIARGPSKEHINRLAQPKRHASQENCSNATDMTLAEAVRKFQSGTPRRFRSNFSCKPTKPHTPKFLTTNRVRHVTAISREEQEKLDMEEAKKYKIKAQPLNKRVLQGPLKPQLEKKTSTVVQPFNLTETKKKVVEKEKVAPFKAQSVPKSILQNSRKIQNQGSTQSHKPTATRVSPFSFEKRDQQLKSKKEKFINQVLEEEKKAREFHARPVPKAILRSRNSSQELISEPGSAKSLKNSMEELDSVTMFKARPPAVLHQKPFKPKLTEDHAIPIAEFHFSTDDRMQARQKFEQNLREKEAASEAQKKIHQEKLERIAKEEVARLRKEMEHKAQPVKKYKEIVIEKASKCTIPISPKFHTDMIRNKENIH